MPTEKMLLLVLGFVTELEQELLGRKGCLRTFLQYGRSPPMGFEANVQHGRCRRVSSKESSHPPVHAEGLSSSSDAPIDTRGSDAAFLSPQPPRNTHLDDCHHRGNATERDICPQMEVRKRRSSRHPTAGLQGEDGFTEDTSFGTQGCFVRGPPAFDQ